MSYAICKIVCGYHVDTPLEDYLYELIDCNAINLEDIDCEQSYSSGGRGPIHCGVVINEFDECQRMTAAEMHVKLTAKKSQRDKARKMLQEMRRQLSEIMIDFDPDHIGWREREERERLLACIPKEPDVHLVWGSS